MKFRFARHTNDLEKIKFFYIDILGFKLIGAFENHNGYDGVFIGKPNENWHLEFTKSKEIITFNFGDENLLVFYPISKLEFDQIQDNLKAHKINFIEAKNPYWNENGIMILDPDGFRVVLSHLKII
jgi:catechol 2,3-dioxygenase-like lactoylglutathione lyase family enzyme